MDKHPRKPAGRRAVPRAGLLLVVLAMGEAAPAGDIGLRYQGTLGTEQHTGRLSFFVGEDRLPDDLAPPQPQAGHPFPVRSEPLVALPVYRQGAYLATLPREPRDPSGNPAGAAPIRCGGSSHPCGPARGTLAIPAPSGRLPFSRPFAEYPVDSLAPDRIGP
ncbi:MAG: hypothetical protein ACLFQ3_09690 [Thiohalorhabdus sp.]